MLPQELNTDERRTVEHRLEGRAGRGVRRTVLHDALRARADALGVAIQRAAIPPLEVTLRQNIDALAVLVARAPANFTVHGGSTRQIAVPRVTPGLPSELLYPRPDIRQAEALLASSNFSVEAARAAFFPQIQLTGTTGFQSAALASE